MFLLVLDLKPHLHPSSGCGRLRLCQSRTADQRPGGWDLRQAAHSAQCYVRGQEESEPLSGRSGGENLIEIKTLNSHCHQKWPDLTGTSLPAAFHAALSDCKICKRKKPLLYRWNHFTDWSSFLRQTCCTVFWLVVSGLWSFRYSRNNLFTINYCHPLYFIVYFLITCTWKCCYSPVVWVTCPTKVKNAFLFKVWSFPMSALHLFFMVLIGRERKLKL